MLDDDLGNLTPPTAGRAPHSRCTGRNVDDVMMTHIGCAHEDSDHCPVLATLKLKLKGSAPASNKRLIPNLSLLSNDTMSQKFAAAASQLSRVSPSELHSVEDLWTKYKNDLDSAAREVLGPCMSAKKPWISQVTLSVIEQRRKAMQRVI